MNQDSYNDHFFTIETNGEPQFVGAHSLSLKVWSNDYPDDISPLYLTIKVEVECEIAELVDDGSVVNFSPIYLVMLPEVDLTVQLPLYVPNTACDGETNADVKYEV